MTELLNWVNKRLGILLSVSGAGGNCSSPVVQEQDGKEDDNKKPLTRRSCAEFSHTPRVFAVIDRVYV
jgi:hypothetical protein